MLGLGLGLSSRAVLGGGMSVAAYLAAAGLTGSNAGADFQNDKYWLPSADALSAPRWASQTEFFALFSRASSATYIDASGVLRTAPADAPRFDYSSGGRRVLLEGGATNLIVQSVGMNSPEWSTAQIVRTFGQPSPDGQNNAVLCTVNGNVDPQVSVTLASGNPSGLTYTFSAWIRVVSRNNNELRRARLYSFGYPNGGGTEAVADVTLNITDEWVRYSWTRTFPAGMTSTLVRWRVDPFDGSDGVNQPSAGSSIAVFGWQVEASPFATSYVPTTSSAASRAADSFALPTAFGGVLSLPAASFLLRFDGSKEVGSNAYISGSDRYAGGNSSGTSVLLVGGTPNINMGNISVPTGPLGIAIGWDPGSKAGSVNNRVAVSTGTTVSINRSTNYLGRNSTGSVANSGYKLLAAYPARLSDATLQALSGT